MASRFFRAYNGALARKPPLIHSITAASLYAVGEAAAQKVSPAVDSKKAPKWDWQRTLRMTAIGIGGLALGPTMVVWYRFLQKRIQLASHTHSVIARVLADQVVFAPASIIGLFYLTEVLQPDKGALEVRLSAAQTNGRGSFVEVLLRNYTLWPAVSYLNFSYVSLQYRLLVSNIVAVFWSACLSFAVNKSILDLEEPQDGMREPQRLKSNGQDS